MMKSNFILQKHSSLCSYLLCVSERKYLQKVQMIGSYITIHFINSFLYKQIIHQLFMSAHLSMLGFVPALVVQYLMELAKQKYTKRKLPEKQALKSVVMFADISGFTNLTETLSKIGPEGAEVIAFAINRYMELLVKGIGKSGGDIFKFAGDAMIVIWPPSNDLKQQCIQAIQSAVEIQQKLKDTNILEDIKLSVKIGFGVGNINIIHVGGVFSRTEYLATGDPLVQAFSAEHSCVRGGQTIISSEVYHEVFDIFNAERVSHGEEHDEHHDGKPFYEVTGLKSNKKKIRMKADALLLTKNINLTKFEEIKSYIQSYIPAALIPFIEIDEERWSSELRRLTIMFVNLGIDLSDAETVEGLNRIQEVIKTVQESVYSHEGSLNKLLMDDKGSTLIIVFGLPPMSHQDDASRAILTAFSMTEELKKIGCACSIGIATGNVFAGVVGTSGSRREYSVLGDSVNLAARLMQTACVDSTHKIIVCENTAQESEHKISTVYYKKVQLKGKQFETPIFLPLDQDQEKLIELNNLNLFPHLRTHRDSFPVFKELKVEDKVLKFSETQMRARQLFMIGRDDNQKIFQSLVDKFLKNQMKKGFISISGTFGVGKTLFLRKILYRVQEKIDSNQYYLWKYNEKSRILVQSVGPISKKLRLCGLRSILRGFFEIYAKRTKRNADITLFDFMIQKAAIKTGENYELLREILGLKQVDKLAHFRDRNYKNDFNKDSNSDLGTLIIEFLRNYFEDTGSETNSDAGQDNQQGGSSQKQGNIIAPLVLCCDDMQNYDKLTFLMLNKILKTFNNILLIGVIRDSYLGLDAFKNAGEKQTPEEILIEGVSRIEQNMLDYSYSIVIRELQRLDKEDEFLKVATIQ